MNGSGDSSLVRRIAGAPHVQAADEARARVNEWLAEIAGLPAGQMLTRLAAAHPRLEALMTKVPMNKDGPAGGNRRGCCLDVLGQGVVYDGRVACGRRRVLRGVGDAGIAVRDAMDFRPRR